MREYRLRIEFRYHWRALSARWKCDSIDGMEYRRVYAEWIKAGRPYPIRDFILRQANRPAVASGEGVSGGE